MLRNPKLGRNKLGTTGEILASILGTSQNDETIAEGLIMTGHWSPDSCFIEPYKQYPGLPDVDGDFNCYGVCDSPEQFMLRHGKSLQENPRQFCVYFVKITKKDSPPEGGWRWHKWGPYIGVQNPQCEYIYDEPVIEEVCTYHVYELNPQS
jgi:hypothetical protein